ncbi:MAG: 2-oxoacid:acceptor oxidoreductase family protein [Candidatus Omnitrophota bacterium]
MQEKVIISGAGGQGIMLLGKILVEAAMDAGMEVTWLPSYGAEVRGGTAYCMAVISDREIGSPFIDKADTGIIMNGPSLGRFKNRIKNKGILFINSSLAEGIVDNKGVRVFRLPFTDAALKLGNLKVANMIALGSYIAETKLIDINKVTAVVERIAPKEKRGLIEVNKEALYQGMELVKNAKG